MLPNDQGPGMSPLHGGGAVTWVWGGLGLSRWGWGFSSGNGPDQLDEDAYAHLPAARSLQQVPHLISTLCSLLTSQGVLQRVTLGRGLRPLVPS